MLKKIFLLIIFILAAVYCQEDPDGNPLKIKITADKTVVTPFEVVTLTAEGYTFTEDEYNANIDNREVKLIKVESNKLSFLMPSISGGIQILTFTVDKVKYNLEFNINALEIIENPDIVIDEFDQSVKTILDTIIYLNTLPNFNIPNQNLQILNNYLSDLDNLVANASSQEKQELAQFINFNSEVFNFSLFDFSFFYEYSKSNTKIDFNDIRLNADQRKFVLLVMAIVPTIDLTTLAIKMKYLPGIIVCGIALGVEVSLIQNYIKIIFDRPYCPILRDIYDFFTESKNTDTLIFKKDIVYRTNIDAYYRTLFNSDLGASSIITDLVYYINVFSEYWNKAVEIIPGLEGEIKNLESISTYLTTEETAPITMAYISVSNITNPDVSRSFFSISDGLKVGFTTIQNTNQVFQFDIVYSNPIFHETKRTINAKLIVEEQTEPYSIEIQSGNNQTGTLGTLLEEPIQVIVKDKNGYPFAGTIVNFEASDGGILNRETDTTNSDGIAETTWKLGSVGNNQTLTATAYLLDGTTHLIGSPLTFTAYGECYTTYESGYESVQIGNQIWMAKNLDIPVGSSKCYNNSSTNCGIYGRLYTWDEAKTACPAGWHLPNQDEWTALIGYLGGSATAGGRMKETGNSHWYGSNIGATNSSCFTALPGGAYDIYAGFNLINYYGYWWSDTISGSVNPKAFIISTYDGSISNNPVNQNNGCSVRCIKD